MFHNHKTNIFFLVLAVLFIGWQLLRPGFFSTHDDSQIMRLYEMDQCFKNGQIPCRWSSELGAGYGQPLFNYYSVFPYYLGELFHLLGFSFIGIVKLLFLTALVVSALGTYLLLIELVSLPAAFIGAITYLVAPYRAVDIFVRGALSEAWALALIPIVLLFILRTIKKPSTNNSILLALSLFAFLTTHNISSLISLPLLILFTSLVLFINKPSLKDLKYLLLGGLFGIGLSAFFTLPVALERNLIQTNFLTSGYFDFHFHFATLKQLFISRDWGFGPSEPGPNDTLSLAVGTIQTLSLIIFPFLIIKKSNTKKNHKIWGIFFWLLSIISVYFTHSRSTFFWDNLSPLQFVQFPWRFLGIAAVCTSAVVAISFDLLSQGVKKYLLLPLFVLLIILNFNFFRFERYLPNLTDQIALTGDNFSVMQMTGVSDYLPTSSKIIPTTIGDKHPTFSSDRVEIINFEIRSNYLYSEFNLYEDNITVTFPVVYYPGWEIHLNRQPGLFPITYDNDLGLITVKLNRGHHIIQGFFENTPNRTIGNLITFVSGLGILIWLVFDKDENKEKY